MMFKPYIQPKTIPGAPRHAKGRRTLATILLLGSMLVACSESPPAANSEPGDIARQVIAEFLSLPVAETILVSLDARNFNDASLDCPEPGMSYAQVVTPGYRAVIEADGRRFDVRVAGSHGRICRFDAKSGQPRDRSNLPANRPEPSLR